jgi:hypothetical protein
MAGRTEKIKRCYALKPQICTLADRLVGLFERLVSSSWDARTIEDPWFATFVQSLADWNEHHSRTQVTNIFLSEYASHSTNNGHNFIRTQHTASDDAVLSSLPVTWYMAPHRQNKQESLYKSQQTLATYLPSWKVGFESSKQVKKHILRSSNPCSVVNSNYIFRLFLPEYGWKVFHSGEGAPVGQTADCFSLFTLWESPWADVGHRGLADSHPVLR